MNYSPIEKLAEELSEKVKDLKSGKLNTTEVNELVKTAQEVYNRMVILEFQMHEKGNVAEAEPVTEAPAEEIPEPEAPVMEAETPEEILEEVQEEEISMPEFNLNMTGEVEIEEETPVEEIVQIEPEPTPELEVKEPELIPEPVMESIAEMAETAASGATKSVAEKFENAPISSISKGYSLNEKFQFMRVFTNNNSKQFSALVETLDDSSDLKSALSLFENSVSKPDGEDLAVYDSFKELIIRRFS